MRNAHAKRIAAQAPASPEVPTAAPLPPNPDAFKVCRLDKLTAATDAHLAAVGRAAVLEHLLELSEQDGTDRWAKVPDDPMFWFGLRSIVKDIHENVSKLHELADEGWRR